LAHAYASAKTGISVSPVTVGPRVQAANTSTLLQEFAVLSLHETTQTALPAPKLALAFGKLGRLTKGGPARSNHTTDWFLNPRDEASLIERKKRGRPTCTAKPPFLAPKQATEWLNL